MNWTGSKWEWVANWTQGPESSVVNFDIFGIAGASPSLSGRGVEETWSLELKWFTWFTIHDDVWLVQDFNIWRLPFLCFFQPLQFVAQRADGWGWGCSWWWWLRWSGCLPQVSLGGSTRNQQNGRWSPERCVLIQRLGLSSSIVVLNESKSIRS